ncbi:serine/threonine protein phosphatase [Thalassococcus profundi]|uniref:Serine/threonine protein phosphatase n=1 Tax=Thalassococcus profundi TaxID=2282382 RepID=A0A369TRG0_9RHOB|nr:metallophosphoesterase family protein [Thalassococcus profundi]RDD67858.1 serine/threonine protein phosphatase [Thalassococcus profundi]
MTDAPIFAVGDIHGQAGMLAAALDRIAADPDAGAPVVFLGDYVDRGPDTRGVIDLLCEGQAAGLPWVLLMGNHDRYMRNFLDGRGPQKPERLSWLDPRVGGRSALRSYGVDVGETRPEADIRADALEAVPARHLDFLRGLKTCHDTEAQIFVHAGLRPGVPLAKQAEHDLLWIRDTFLDDPRDHGKLVVHGHTALDGPVHYGNRLNLDGGAGYGRPLSAARLVGRRAWLLSGRGRIAL